MYIGIDIGGTSIRIAGFTSLENAQPVKTVKFPTLNDYEKDLQNLIAGINEVNVSHLAIKAIGVGIAGLLNKEKSALEVSPNLQSWLQKPFQKDLEEVFHCLVILENDALVSGKGEAWFGLGKGESFLFIVWGTGIGGAFIKYMDGKSYIFPSEPGHQIIKPDGDLCLCGQRGCLEVYCGGGNVKRRYRKNIAELTDEEAEVIFRDFAQGLTNLLAMNYSPLVILSGSGALRQKERILQLPKVLAQQLKIYPVPKIVVSELGDLGALYGALSLIEERKSGL